MKVKFLNHTIKLRKIKLAAVLAVSFMSGALTGNVQAQTAPEGGWKGVGYLSSIKFTSLEPTRCSYRLIRAGKTFPIFPGSIESYAIGYLPLSGYDVAQIPSVGKITSMKFEVPLSRVGDYALAVVGEYPVQAYFFESIMQTMKTPSCQIVWSYGSKVLPTDTVKPGSMKPVLKCRDLRFDGGTLPQESEITSSIDLDPSRLSLQKDSSCK